MPQVNNATLISRKGYFGELVNVKCIEGYIPKNRNFNMAIRCAYNQTIGKLVWFGIERIVCIPNSCPPNKDSEIFGKKVDQLEYYQIGHIIDYVCPNGYHLRTRCAMNQTNGLAEWDFKGSCKGMIFILLLFVRFNPIKYKIVLTHEGVVRI